jgi:hypothetical protein
VRVDGKFRGDYHQKEHALAAAALHKLSPRLPVALIRQFRRTSRSRWPRTKACRRDRTQRLP